MAIWITEERGKPGKVFGHTDNFNGLGIFLDTYKNSRPGVTFPYVMAMLGNSSVSYDKDHDGKDNELAGCSVCQLRPELLLRLLMFVVGSWHPNWGYHTHKNSIDVLRRKLSTRRPTI